MRGSLAPLLLGLLLAWAAADAAAQAPGHAGTAASAARGAGAPPAATRDTRAPQASIEGLQHAVSAAEARHQEIQRRLDEQDRKIQALRRQLQDAGNPKSTQSH